EHHSHLSSRRTYSSPPGVRRENWRDATTLATCASSGPLCALRPRVAAVGSPAMTFSIVAFDPESESCGVAVASKCLAVGHAVPWGGARRGPIAPQALANLEYGPGGLELLAEGADAGDVVARLTVDDPLV